MVTRSATYGLIALCTFALACNSDRPSTAPGVPATSAAIRNAAGEDAPVLAVGTTRPGAPPRR